MKESTPREQILARIRNALLEKLDNPYQEVDFNAEIFASSPEANEPEVLFAKELIEAGGQFIYCENEKSFLDYLQILMQQKKWKVLCCRNKQLADLLTLGSIPNLFEIEADDDDTVGITICEKLIARSGSIMVSTAEGQGRTAFAPHDVHIVKAYASQVVLSLKDAFAALRSKYKDGLPSQITVITGPSRTADIEKTLVMGAHGPKELYVFLIDDL
jgi:L-lactate dehydrogenase complex protein LldG